MVLRIKGVSFDISFSFIAVISLFVICDVKSGFILCVFAVILHECGHLLAMKICGLNVSTLKISAFDIKIIEKERYKTSLAKDLFIISMGPFANILCYLIFLFFNADFAYVNLLIGLFNLLPASLLDGGQLLYMILNRFMNNADTIVDILTIIISVPLFIIGILILMNSKYNFSLLFIGLYLFLGVFIRKDKYL